MVSKILTTFNRFLKWYRPKLTTEASRAKEPTKSIGKYSKYILIYLLMNSFSLSFGQRLVHRGPVRMWVYGVLGFLFFVLIFLLFSIIFWVVYLYLVKSRSDKDKKENKTTI